MRYYRRRDYDITRPPNGDTSVTPSLTKRLKEIDNVLLRVPSALRELAAEQASSHSLSQNAFITNSLLFGVLVYGEKKYVGHPDNVIALVTEIDKALEADDAVMTAFHSQDWKEVEHLVSVLETCEIITKLKVRPDTKAGDETTVFSFVLSKNGKQTWPILRGAFMMLAQRLSGQELLPMS